MFLVAEGIKARALAGDELKTVEIKVEESLVNIVWNSLAETRDSAGMLRYLAQICVNLFLKL